MEHIKKIKGLESEELGSDAESSVWNAKYSPFCTDDTESVGKKNCFWGKTRTSEAIKSAVTRLWEGSRGHMII